jgi:hypothetical protein
MPKTPPQEQHRDEHDVPGQLAGEQRLVARPRRAAHGVLLGRLEGQRDAQRDRGDQVDHRICTGVIGSVMPNSSATMMVMASPPLVGRVQLMTFLMLS